MILDGYWRLELHITAFKLRFWQVLSCTIKSKYIEHQINKLILLSAIAIRKIIEDELNAKKIIKNSELSAISFPISDYKVDTVRYQFVGDKDWIIENVCADNYGKPAVQEQISLKHLCNQLIHAFVWNLAYEYHKKEIHYFLVASDHEKEKLIYCVSLKDWLCAIKFCRDNSTM